MAAHSFDRFCSPALYLVSFCIIHVQMLASVITFAALHICDNSQLSMTNIQACCALALQHGQADPLACNCRHVACLPAGPRGAGELLQTVEPCKLLTGLLPVCKHWQWLAASTLLHLTASWLLHACSQRVHTVEPT